MATTALSPAALLLTLLLAAGSVTARRGPRPFGRCASSVGDIDRDTMMKIVRNFEVPDETSDDQKCMLRCALMTNRLVRDGVLDARQILMNIQADAHFAGRMASVYGQKITLDMDRLSNDVEACVTSEENPDCDTVYNQFKCVSDLISNGNMASYASFVEVDGSEPGDWMRRRQMLTSRPHGPPGPMGGHWGPPPPHHRGGPRGGGRPPPPPPESDENDVEELE
ncbi:uncharacterized protein LOC126483935 [Schistocerca serialis cubense]|uniref:uncharacterized protein LOC126483935 n=1 Tax=Schistocerca serialis cubense TaxID=2023355 RepID=UPI00214E2334|nr:uncharacterized protein LOC126483935 [Schistocerca serialis cubense]